METRKRLPDFLKTKLAPSDEPKNRMIRDILKRHNLNTVCNEARCPNKAKCYGDGVATFLIMGKVCTRNCCFCNIEKGRPQELNPNEAESIAKAVLELNLNYCVLTSVTRDDLPYGGAKCFYDCINEIRKTNNKTKIEILTPDFKGDKEALDIIIKSNPDVFNHNIETVPRLYKTARNMADYKRSLDVLKYIKDNSKIITKTGIMTGLGETKEELEQTFLDVKNAKCDILTIGQYIQPSKKHLTVEKYYTPEEFNKLADIAKKTGIKEVISTPLARSSYMAYQSYLKVKE